MEKQRQLPNQKCSTFSNGQNRKTKLRWQTISYGSVVHMLSQNSFGRLLINSTTQHGAIPPLPLCSLSNPSALNQNMLNLLFRTTGYYYAQTKVNKKRGKTTQNVERITKCISQRFFGGRFHRTHPLPPAGFNTYCIFLYQSVNEDRWELP